MDEKTTTKAAFHPVVQGAEFACEIGESLRLTTVEFEGEEMVGIEVLRESGQIIAYPITATTARQTAAEMIELAGEIEKRREGEQS